MREETRKPRSYQFSHMLILISFTVLVGALIGESFLLKWELWPLVPITLSVIFCWVMHIRRMLTETQRLWVYAVSMMCTFFFYGVHVTSTYDLAMVAVGIIMLYTTTGERGLVRLVVITYFLTLPFDLLELIKAGTQWDGLLVTRTILHVAVVFLAGWVGQIIIKQWATLFYQSDQQLDELNEATGRMNVFMANLSHELRTPLNLILGTSDGLQGTEDADELRYNMKTIHTAGLRMEVQTDDILNYSELATGNLTVNDAPCILSSVLNDLVASLRPIIPERLALVIDVDRDIPTILISDANKLKKIMWHIISNSLKYSRDGGVYVHLSCARRAYGINLQLKVTDTGVGMTKEELENVFNQFYQANSSSSVHSGGLGIGLCITGGFVRAMGGFMTVESEAGEGTTVRVSLPMSVQDERNCIALKTKKAPVVGGFLKYLEYPDPRVREFYNTMLRNLVNGLGITLHRVKTIGDLKKMSETLPLTHLFVGEDEYKSDPDLIESLARRMTVALVADDGSLLRPGSHVHLLQKPFYCFPAINILEMSPADGPQVKEVMRCTGVRVLVVDDEPMNLQVARNVLRRYEMDVTTIGSGLEALDMCANTGFDLIFMDHMMPEMDGLETMRQIRMTDDGENLHTPIVMLTANTLSASRDLFSRAGADGFVGKPIDIAELERVLKRLLPVSAIHYETVEQMPASVPALLSAQLSAPTREPSSREVTEATEPAEGAQTAVAAEKSAGGPLAALGIDAEEGLRYVDGDEEFYYDLLSQFAGEAHTKVADLRRFFETKDFSSYVIVVHALKSTAKMIGAGSLSEMAKTLEEAAKREDAQVIEPLHPKMMRAYEELCDGLRAFIGTQTGTEAEVEGGFEDEDEILEFLPDGEEGQ
ncbi:MAG: response regulator [Coriobacteriales bacterium]|nr:response regulator [Coriobacteriales bacterium]